MYETAHDSTTHIHILQHETQKERTYKAIQESVTNKGWQDKQFKNMYKKVLKAASGLLKCTFSIFVGFISFK